jgi:biopolymer transport protein ExbB
MAARPESHVVALGALEQKSQVSAYFSMLGGIASMVSLTAGSSSASP